VRAILLSVSALILGLFLLLAGNSLQFVILGLRADREGFSTLVIGGLTAAYYFGYAVGTFQAPRIVAQIGHIRSFAAVGTIISAVVLAHALWVHPAFWMVLRVMTGLSFAVLATVAESWLNAKATRHLRGRVLSVAAIAMMSGYAVGPLFTGLGSVDGFVLFIAASILMSIAVVPVVVTRIPAPQIASAGVGDKAYSPWRLYKETPLGVVGTAGIGAVQGAFLGLGAVFAGRLGFDDRTASLFMTGALVAGMAVQYPLGLISDRLDRRRVFAVCTLVLAVGAAGATAALSVLGPRPAVMALAAAVAGIAAVPLYAVAIAHANDRLPESSIVPAAATLILSFSVGSMIAGPFASTAMEAFGPPGLFGFLAAVLAALALFTFVRMTVREDAPAPEGEAEETAWPGQESGVFASTPQLRPMDREPEEEQLAFDFAFPESRG